MAFVIEAYCEMNGELAQQAKELHVKAERILIAITSCRSS